MLIWLLIALGTVLGVMVSWNLVSDHQKAAEQAHDAQFVRKDEYVQAIVKLTDAINKLAVSADVGRGWLQTNQLGLNAAVANLTANLCHKDNPKDAAVACRTQDQASQQAANDANEQKKKASDVTNASQAVVIQAPIPTQGKP